MLCCFWNIQEDHQEYKPFYRALGYNCNNGLKQMWLGQTGNVEGSLALCYTKYTALTTYSRTNFNKTRNILDRDIRKNTSHTINNIMQSLELMLRYIWQTFDICVIHLSLVIISTILLVFICWPINALTVRYIFTLNVLTVFIQIIQWCCKIYMWYFSLQLIFILSDRYSMDKLNLYS